LQKARRFIGPGGLDFPAPDKQISQTDTSGGYVGRIRRADQRKKEDKAMSSDVFMNAVSKSLPLAAEGSLVDIEPATPGCQAQAGSIMTRCGLRMDAPETGPAMKGAGRDAAFNRLIRVILANGDAADAFDPDPASRTKSRLV